MTQRDKPRFYRGKFIKSMSKIYHPFGFKKGYNFSLFIIFSGAMHGFILARFPYLNVTDNATWSYKIKASPGE
ncbi:hypothetical protein BDZ45DRAFT_753438 [Acephala macrosclerotiorum]|nr:hypothetical protein BDZ45DRAFT_753438 [Acephala macrosclerotiorum]